MRTSNPALNEQALARVVPEDHMRAGWAAPATQLTPAPDTLSPWTPAPPLAAPGDTMTIGGAISATAVLLVLLCAAGFVGWNAVEIGPNGQADFPGWLIVAMIVGIGAMFATIFRPQWARVTAPLYALSYGTIVGGISRVYEQEYEGVVFQATVGTFGVLAIMLFLHATRIIKVTEKFRMGVVMATGAIAVMYLFNLVLSIFGVDMPFLHESSPIGILISVAIIVVASLNLLLDFDFIEKATAAGAPKATEWYAAFGLVVTLVWLYLEMLRLLAILQGRD